LEHPKARQDGITTKKRETTLRLLQNAKYTDFVNIYDNMFARFGLKISTGKTETMAFNVDEKVKAY